MSAIRSLRLATDRFPLSRLRKLSKRRIRCHQAPILRPNSVSIRSIRLVEAVWAPLTVYLRTHQLSVRIKRRTPLAPNVIKISRVSRAVFKSWSSTRLAPKVNPRCSSRKLSAHRPGPPARTVPSRAAATSSRRSSCSRTSSRRSFRRIRAPRPSGSIIMMAKTP